MDINSSIWIAVKEGNIKGIGKWVKYGANIDEVGGNMGCTPLYVAVRYEQREAMQLLIREGANVNACNENGDTPLLLSVSMGSEYFTDFLLSAGASVHTCASNGNTVLQIAITKRHESVASMLLRYGASLNAADMDALSKFNRSDTDGAMCGTDRVIHIELLNDMTGRKLRGFRKSPRPHNGTP